MREPLDSDVREIVAAAEEITRTVIGKTLDNISESAVERSAKWLESQETIDHLKRLQRAINNGEEMVWAVVDFHLSRLPDPNGHVVKMSLTDEEYDAISDLAASHGTNVAGYCTMLAQKAVMDLNAAREDTTVNRKRPMLIVASSQQQADQFIMRNAVALTGWAIVTHPYGGAGTDRLRGQTYEMVVIITDVTNAVIHDLAVLARLGDTPTLVKVEAGPEDRFDPKDAIAQQAEANRVSVP